MSGRESKEEGISSNIRSMLTEMDAIVKRLHLSEKEAYVEACRRNPAYAQGDGLKLRFLRVENYNTGLAAHRLCQYFDFKLNWFGQRFLARPMLLSDLSSDDLALLRRGDFQLLEQQDADRRRILHYICWRHNEKADSPVGTHHDEVACRRALFFFLDSIAVDDEEVQKHGITTIISSEWGGIDGGLTSFHHPNVPRNDKYNSRRQPLVDLEFLFEVGRFLAFAAPLKVVQLHFVHQLHSIGLGEIAHWLSSITKLLHGRASFFSHQIGSHGDLHERLLRHGIPADVISIIDDQFWGYKRNFAFDGRLSTAEDSLIGRKQLPQKRSFTETSCSSSFRNGLDSKSTSNNREEGFVNHYFDSRVPVIGVRDSPVGGNMIESRSPLVLDALSSCRRDVVDHRVHGYSNAKHQGMENSLKKRKLSGTVTLPSILYFDDDADHLSPYQCLLRQQIEAFEACSDDVQYNASRMNRGIILSQVGLRCRHCAGSPEWERANGAVYYPGRLDMLYQASQNMAKNHLCTTCQKIPAETRDLLSILRTDKRRATAGKEYWAQAAQRMGIYEEDSQDSKSSRLRFRQLPPPT